MDHGYRSLLFFSIGNMHACMAGSSMPVRRRRLECTNFLSHTKMFHNCHIYNVTCSFIHSFIHSANVYQRRADVLNRGHSGYNTRFFLRLLPDILRDEQLAPPLPVQKTAVQKTAAAAATNKGGGQVQQEEPEPADQEEEPTVVLTIIFFGANDAAVAGLDDHHHVPLDEYADNLRHIVDEVRQETHCRRFLLVTPPPVHHAQRLQFQVEKYGEHGATGVLERTLENTGRYAQACRDVATSLQIPCLDLYHDMQQRAADTDVDADNDNADSDFWGRFFYDGLHFSKTGHDFVGAAMVQAINAAFGDDLHVVADERTGQWCNSASKCPSALLRLHGKNGGASGGGPYHDEIDATDPDRAFFEYHHHGKQRG
jgi:lysophospholipase L1-like esterase